MTKADIQYLKGKVLAEESVRYGGNYEICRKYYSMAMKWLEENIGKFSKKWISSYELKHQCEEELPPFGSELFKHGYVSNNLMKVALIESGYKCMAINLMPITEADVLSNKINLYNANFS